MGKYYLKVCFYFCEIDIHNIPIYWKPACYYIDIIYF